MITSPAGRPAVAAVSPRTGTPGGDPPRDGLTGLAGRRALGQHVRAARSEVVLVAVDLDGFRRINEEAGHEVGDQALQHVAATLAGLAGPDGLAVRLDGDDFALVVPGRGPDAGLELARRVQEAIGEALDLDGRRLHLRSNVGVVLGHPRPTDHRTDEGLTAALLRCADAALARAQVRPSGIAVHDQVGCTPVDSEALLQTIDDLHVALSAVGSGLTVHLQAQVRLGGGGAPDDVTGCEALLRWQHPTRGLLGPEPTLRAARVARLGRALSNHVLDVSLGAAGTWWPIRPCPVSVNLTAEDLDDDAMPDLVGHLLDLHHLPAAALTVEVVEDSLMVDPVRASSTLSRLRGLGVRVAIDDFGVGYSSLAWLHRLPIDEVKLDRSLVVGLCEDAAATAIARHSIALAHDLGLEVVAEGVERADDLALLRDLRCDVVQGYLIGRPVPPADWLAFLLGG